jgi:hypothetical protein
LLATQNEQLARLSAWAETQQQQQQQQFARLSAWTEQHDARMARLEQMLAVVMERSSTDQNVVEGDST